MSPAHLLLLPGLDGTGSLYEPLGAALGGAAELEVLAYPPDQRLGYEELLPLARAACPSDRPWWLIGESFSGPLAVRLAAGRPPGLQGLILCATFARAPLPLPHWLPRAPAFTFAPRPLMRWLMFDAAASEVDVDAFMAAIAQVRPEVLAHRARAALGVDVRSELASLEVPVLFLRPEADRLMGPSTLREVLAACPSAQVARFEGAPHLLLQRRAAEVAEVVSRAVA